MNSKERRYIMTKQEFDVLLAIAQKKFDNQREIAEYTGNSLGIVNKSLRELNQFGFVASMSITEKGLSLLKANKPKQAIILAAGFGMRMVPINHETPKAFLEIDGQLIALFRLCSKEISNVKTRGLNFWKM